MDVFVRGIPERATENQLTEFLRPILSELAVDDWDCQKRKGKTFALLTFLRVKDGDKFLSRYDHSRLVFGSTRDEPGLIFNGIPLACSRSRNPPDPWGVKNLEMQAKGRREAKAQPSASRTVPTITSVHQNELAVKAIRCGEWNFQDSQPVFVAYRQWPVNGSVKFTASRAIIKTDDARRIDIIYSTVHEVAIHGAPAQAMTFTLTVAPMFFRVESAINDLIHMTRNLHLQKRSLTTINRTRLPSIDKEHALIAGSCLVYQIVLVNASISVQLQALAHAHLLPSPIRQHVAVRSASAPFQTKVDALLLAFETPTLPFPIKFQLQKLVTQGYLPSQLVIAILPEVRRLVRRCTLRKSVSILRRLFPQIPYRCFEADPTVFDRDSLVSLIRDNERRINSGEFDADELIDSDNVAYIHRVSVTPAQLFLSGPEPENNNRVLRKYPDHHDCFIRVQFCDEDGDMVRYNAEISNEEVFQSRFKKVLNEGFSLAGQHFSFLGFSHSSLRAQSCWFMAPFIYNGTLLFDRMLIRGLGDFTQIRSPAKCAARIGQAFSETPTAVTLAPGVAKSIPDVERNGRVFSDGVGTMSLSVLRQIWSHLPAKEKGKPLLFQIRYGGAKGMIALDSRLEGNALRLRPSMIKFPAPDTLDLELCNGSYKPLPYYLNHQTIKILEDMGVDDEFFLHHQAQEVQRLRSTTSSTKLASEFLKRHAIGEKIHLAWFINKLGVLNLSFQNDQFLRNIVEIAVLIELRSLKYKARIPVKHGYTLFGIMDETGFLNEGEVFVIVETEGKGQVITGQNLLVSRSPALHPGDIQLAKGVTVPTTSPLAKLRNCICFSQKGSRDLPSKLSGGDLDGDLYQVLFDPKARAKRVFAPADYPRANPVDLGRAVVREDMTDFFVQFMATDQLGRIANTHKILADQRSAGTQDLDCLTLAEMHSTAVDFSKSGIPVDLSKMPRFSPYRPDFMAFGPQATVSKTLPLSFNDTEQSKSDSDDDSPRYKYYESTKILGRLFRSIDEREVFAGVQKSGKPRTSGSHILNEIWLYVEENCQDVDDTLHHMDRARGIRDEYEDCVRNLSWEYSPDTTRPLSEREVFIGNILGRTGAQSKKQHDLAVSLKDRFNSDLAYIVNCMTKDDSERSEESVERSAACFLVSFEKNTGLSAAKRGEELVSFRYVAAAVCLREIEISRSAQPAVDIYGPSLGA